MVTLITVNKVALLLFITLLVPLSPAQAANGQRQTLKAVQSQLQEETRRREELQAQSGKIQGDLESTRDKLVKTSQAVRINEQTLDSLEKSMATLEEQKAAINESLQKDRKGLSRLILALERIRRVPPEALIAKPGAPLATAQSAMLLKELLPALYKQAEQLRANLATLASVSEELNAKKMAAEKTQADLKTQSGALQALVDKREKLYASTTQDLAKQEDNVRRISAQAASLQDLVRKLDENQRTQSLKSSKTAMAARPTPPPRAGQAQLPVTGMILTRFSEPDAFGAPSKGLTIEARPGALVIAPMAGVVRFAGTFRNYGQLVILEHADGYHSLIAGLEKIDTVVGQSVSAGEPVGRLGRNPATGKASLYYELRKRGDPINPARIFTDLG